MKVERKTRSALRRETPSDVSENPGLRERHVRKDGLREVHRSCRQGEECLIKSTSESESERECLFVFIIS